jgi:hypothetical protein
LNSLLHFGQGLVGLFRSEEDGQGQLSANSSPFGQ